jgi:hypothetical protein
MNWMKMALKVVWGQCDFENMALMVGTLLVARGVYLWWPPAAWIVVGCILMVIWVILVVTSVLSQRGSNGNR